MLWHGFKHLMFSKLRYKQQLKKQNIKLRTLSFVIPTYRSLYVSTFFIHVPALWAFLTLKSPTLPNIRLLYFYSANYFFKLPIIKTHGFLTFDPQTSLISMKPWVNYTQYKLYLNIISFIFYSFSRVFFQKLKF